MAKIEVKTRTDVGDLGVHLKYGALKPGAKIVIDEEDFSAALFERPSSEFLSPHEQTDKARALELKQSVGTHTYEPPLEQSAPVKKGASIDKGKEE